MRMLSAVLTLMLLSFPAPRPAAGEFDLYAGDGAGQLATIDPLSAPGADEPVVTSITDKASWDKLLKAVTARPTQVQTMGQGGAACRIYSITTRIAVPGQQCQNGTAPYNSIFISKAVGGGGDAIYPARISLVCRDEAGIKDALYVDADINGKIIDAAVFNGSLGLLTHPLTEKPAGLSVRYSFDAFLGKVVKHFAAISRE